MESEENVKRGRGRPRKWESPDAMAEAIEQFFDHCESTGNPRLITSLSLHLGLTREGLREYGLREEYSDMIRHAHERCVDWLFVASIRGDTAPGPSIFALKALHRFTDRVDVTSGDKPLTREAALNMSDAELLAIAEGSSSK